MRRLGQRLIGMLLPLLLPGLTGCGRAVSVSSGAPTRTETRTASSLSATAVSTAASTETTRTVPATSGQAPPTVSATSAVTTIATSSPTPSTTRKEPADMYDASRIHGGNTARIAAAMRKSRRGETITIAAVGGSITEGASASSENNRYLSLVAAWWRAAFPGAAVDVVNAGVGATGSVFAAVRLEKDVLVHRPDLVLVDFAVNDGEAPYCAESYEGVVRRLLESPGAPGVLLLFMSTDAYTNADALEIPVGRHYDLPMISLKEALQYKRAQGTDAAGELLADSVHPNDAGHALLADLIIHELAAVKESLNGAPAPIPRLPAPLSANRFAAAKLHTTDRSPAANDGWMKTDQLFRQLGTGWIPERPGAAITFEVEGSLLFLAYLQQIDGQGGYAKVFVDGMQVDIVNAHFDNGWGDWMDFHPIWDGAPGKHTVQIVFLNTHPPGSSGATFGLFGLLTA